MAKSVKTIQPIHISPTFLFLMARTKEQIFRWLLVPRVYVYDFKRFGLKVSPNAKSIIKKWQQQLTMLDGKEN